MEVIIIRSAFTAKERIATTAHTCPHEALEELRAYAAAQGQAGVDLAVLRCSAWQNGRRC